MRLNRNTLYRPSASREEQAIQRIVEYLDDIAIRYEACWGVDRLVNLAPPDLAQKWHAQIAKVNAAIDDLRPDLLADLSGGVERGWKALEDAALKAGHRPFDPDAWDAIAPSGETYRVVKNNSEAWGAKNRQDVNVVTLIEVINIYDAVMKGHIRVDDVAKHAKANSFAPLPEGGDEIPFP